ncbi:HD domain-containing protein [Eggerthella sinensis]|uniref:HD domain-containing protein n=1 Tax=Eggerthella sinensis TaxID=242230 RepID=UPI0022E57691|nr:HD domain-containing protein [Eggerthella sinensis]
MQGFEQRTPYHIYDVLEHTARVIDGVPPYPLVRWAALFHDMGKPAAFFTDEDGTGHFYGHAAISVMLARGIMERLALSSAFITRVLVLVERHDDVIERTPKAVKRALSRLGGDSELFAALCDLKRGDARGRRRTASGAWTKPTNSSASWRASSPPMRPSRSKSSRCTAATS